MSTEERIVWLEDVSVLPYVRESVCVVMRRRGRMAHPLGRDRGAGRVVGYTECAKGSAPYRRRVFWLKEYDRAIDPGGLYKTDQPAEAVIPACVVL